MCFKSIHSDLLSVYLNKNILGIIIEYALAIEYNKKIFHGKKCL